MSYFEGKKGMNDPLDLQKITSEESDAQDNALFYPPKKYI